MVTFLTSGMEVVNSPNNINDVSDSVVEISKAISNYGIAIVIMAVFFVIFMIMIIGLIWNHGRMINSLVNNKSNTDEQTQQLVSKLVDNALDSKGLKDNNSIVSTLTKELRETIKPIEQAVVHDEDKNNDGDYHKDIVGAYIDINMAFKDISRNVMDSLKCDRVAIYVFHNGNQSMFGLPFFKMSCVHEWTSHGNSTLRGKSHTDMPLHLYNDFIEDIWNNGIYKSSDVNKSAEEDPSIKEFTAFSNTESLYMISVKNTEGSLAGFVSAEFSHKEDFTNETRDNFVRTILEDMANKISPIVGSKYVYQHKK